MIEYYVDPRSLGNASARPRPPKPGREGGRGIHSPAPGSASLYRLRRQTVLRGTANPSSRQRVRGSTNGRLWGPLVEREAHAIHLPTHLSTMAHLLLRLQRKRRSQHPPMSHSVWACAGRSFPPPCQSPPARAGGVRLHRTRLRERNRWSSGGQSAAEGRRAKRWPEEDHRLLSLPHAEMESPLPGTISLHCQRLTCSMPRRAEAVHHRTAPPATTSRGEACEIGRGCLRGRVRGFARGVPPPGRN